MDQHIEHKLNTAWNQQFKSAGERKIADFLTAHHIHFIYEQGILVEIDGQPKIWHPDFYLPEFGIYIEYYGLAGNPDYDQGIQRKNTTYTNMGLKVIAIYPDHLQTNWRAYLLNQIRTITHHRANLLAHKHQNLPDQPTTLTTPRHTINPLNYLQPPILQYHTPHHN